MTEHGHHTNGMYDHYLLSFTCPPPPPPPPPGFSRVKILCRLYKRKARSLCVLYAHAKDRICALKDPAAHVGIWWIIQTPKEPSMHYNTNNNGQSLTTGQSWKKRSRDRMYKACQTIQHPRWVLIMPSTVHSYFSFLASNFRCNS